MYAYVDSSRTGLACFREVETAEKNKSDVKMSKTNRAIIVQAASTPTYWYTDAF